LKRQALAMVQMIIHEEVKTGDRYGI
jgi:hypothetical protein